MNLILSALRLLTALPCPGPECRRPADSLYAFPLVGALLGGLLAASTRIPLPPLPLAVLLVAGQVLLTRGFHLDGLADSADGLGGGFTRERALAIMKDSHIGAFGTLALILDCLMKVALLHSLLMAGQAGYALFAAMTLARTAMVMACTLWPCARPGGTGARMIEEARPVHLAVALVAGGLLVIPAAGVALLGTLPVGLGITWLWGRYSYRRLGGMTGDLLGATNELVELGVLFVWVVTA